ncbi:MAG: hypothetical protein R3E96_12420 [Planctomycetota bacterium]
MKNRFAWILPLLLGAAVASLVWWKSTLPEYVHGALSRPGESTQGGA